MEMSGENKKQVLHLNGIRDYTNKIICYQPSSITTNGLWQGQDPLDFSLPLFILQLMIIVLTTQIIVIILKPFRLPKVISEILGVFDWKHKSYMKTKTILAGSAMDGGNWIPMGFGFIPHRKTVISKGGVVLGPSGFGAIGWIGKNIFPLKSIMVLETMANIGLLYYLFLVGVEMDVTIIKRSSKQTLLIAAFGFFLPVIIYISLYVILEMIFLEGSLSLMKNLFLSVYISFTAFPVMSRILVDLKLFKTELGRNGMSAALAVDLCAWFIITICVGWAENDRKISYVAIVGNIVFVVLCIVVIRPAILWIINHTPEEENFSNFYICLILTGVMISGFVTNAIGITSVFGAFIFGLIIPNGSLGITLLEKLEDFVSTLLLPLFFAIVGIKTNILYIIHTPNDNTFRYNIIFFVCTLFAMVTKVLSTFLVGLYFDMQMHEALSLGLLMNTKGVIDLVFLNEGFNNEVIGKKLFTIAVICTVVGTSIGAPIILALYRTSKRFISYKQRTIQNSKTDGELKILMCIHTPRNVSAMINLLEASNATKRSRIQAYVLYLVELTGRASSMLIVHSASESGVGRRKTNNLTQVHYEYIVKAYERYTQNATNVIVQPFTAISPYHTMHEDICNFAADKRAALIILPFHKQQTIDGGMEFINPALRYVNQNVLANAACSVGIVVDRGLDWPTSQISHHIAVIFFGGSDDREALAYGWRMAESEGVHLTVIRFVSKDDIIKPTTKTPAHDEIRNAITNTELEMQLDNEYIGDFKLQTVGRETIRYMEKVVSNAEDIVATIRDMGSIHNLYITGVGKGESPLLVGLSEFSDSPELGVIGDLLTTLEFTSPVSVLVVQQYVGGRAGGSKIKLIQH